MNKIFLFDIDGTLSKDGIIPESAKRVLELIRSKGDRIILCTGRCKYQLKPIEEEIEFDGAIMNNGGYAEMNGTVFSDYPIPREVIYRMDANGEHIAFAAQDGYYRYEENPVFLDFAAHFNVPASTLETRSIMDDKVYSLGLYTYTPDRLDKSLYPEVDFVQVCHLGFDVIAKGRNKGTALEDLRKAFPGNQMIAFGDNYNDLEMLQAADISVAMASAPEEVKRAATYVTRNVFEDGIEYAVKELLKYED